MEATARKRRITHLAAALALGLCATATGLHAQASRTWVSGVGDDANPCSRTAPCKTFAGAISKTAAGGEINALDPGGYGAVTITKAITIDGGGMHASTLAAGTNGFVINAGANDAITLRNLSVNGNGTGINGIRFLAGSALHVENVTIFGFAQKAIDFEPNTNARLWVRDCVIRGNNNGGSAGGILIKPAATFTAVVSIEDTQLDRNFFGLRVEDGSKVTISRSVISGSNGNGIQVIGSSVATQVNVEDSVISANGTNGVLTSGSFAAVQLSDTTVTGNNLGLNVGPGSAVVSFGNNRIRGNNTDGAPTSTIGTN